MKMTKNTRMMTKNNSSDKKSPFLWLLIPASAVVLAIILNSFVILSAIVPSDSMADTLEEGSLLVASRLAYVSSSPSRGDVIIFSHPEIDAKYVVKRVIATPGDTVEIKEGRVYLNASDMPIEELYVSEFSKDNMECVTVPEGCYFVLGDNRCHSVDSRKLTFRFVREDDIYAGAVFTLLPKIKSLK